MKKVLFATTALVATASVAAADVSFGGYGRFGLLYQDVAGVDSTDITSRFRLQIDATAESDAGVTFGGRIYIQSEERDFDTAGERAANGQEAIIGSGNQNGSGAKFSGARMFARSGGLEVGVGNIFGALEFMPGMYPIDLGLTGHAYDYTAFSGADAIQYGDGLGGLGKNGVEVLYSMGDFSVHVSATEGNDVGEADRVAAHVAYKWNGWTFALAGQDSDVESDTEFALSVSGTFGPADVTLAYAEDGDDTDRIVLAGRFDVGAATNIEAYVSDDTDWEDVSIGVDFNHDLGGGTSLRGGISSGGSISTATERGTLVDFGVRFNF